MSTPGTIFAIGELRLTVFGLFIALGLAGGYFIALNRGKQLHIRLASIESAFLGMLVGGIIGGRLLYAAIKLKYYIESCGSLAAAFRIWQGGYSVFGALIGGVLGIRISMHKKGFKRALDFMMPSMLVILAVWRLGELSTWQGRGMIIDNATLGFPFTISNASGARSLAICVYEAVAALALLPYALGSSKRHPAGEMGFTCLMLLGLMQVPLESMRTDEFLAMGFVKIDQLAGMVLAVTFVSMFLSGHLRAHGSPIAGFGALAVTLGMVGMCVAEEFEIDGSPNPVLNYLKLGLYVLIIAVCAVYLRSGWRKSFAVSARPASKFAPQWTPSPAVQSSYASAARPRPAQSSQNPSYSRVSAPRYSSPELEAPVARAARSAAVSSGQSANDIEQSPRVMAYRNSQSESGSRRSRK